MPLPHQPPQLQQPPQSQQRHQQPGKKMASPSFEYFRSSFDNVFQILPQGHEKALKKALYNTAANFFVIFASLVVVAGYFVLQAFLRPLLWAVLCGTFLYPFKRTLTSGLRSWLQGLDQSGTPFAAGLVLLPLKSVHDVSEMTLFFLGFILSSFFSTRHLITLIQFGSFLLFSLFLPLLPFLPPFLPPPHFLASLFAPSSLSCLPFCPLPFLSFNFCSLCIY
ncbi:unnamed protein product [Acanthosepion pharaonis]|uniref:Uncharacterized protein n=1 Tax=Acanthosepion pharaonis TaxID=158019 RepID=A0A812DVH3_ACAPH|nr:unnamed protein product [Sepia pharaonis]